MRKQYVNVGHVTWTIDLCKKSYLTIGFYSYCENNENWTIFEMDTENVK